MLVKNVTTVNLCVAFVFKFVERNGLVEGKVTNNFNFVFCSNKLGERIQIEVMMIKSVYNINYVDRSSLKYL